MMINNYIDCEDCIYQDICENFDPFFGCPDGKSIELNRKLPITLLDCEDNEICYIKE